MPTTSAATSPAGSWTCGNFSPGPRGCSTPTRLLPRASTFVPPRRRRAQASTGCAATTPPRPPCGTWGDPGVRHGCCTSYRCGTPHFERGRELKPDREDATMQPLDKPDPLHVEITANGCDVPAD